MSAGAPDLRASDADREAVADRLAEHCSERRLEVAELEKRLTAAPAARTIGELDRLVADLPGGRPQPVAAAPRIKVGLPGLRSFYQRHYLRSSRETAFDQALEHIVPSMVRIGYEVVESSEPELLVFELSERPIWTILVAVFTFPIGLVALVVREKNRVVVTLDEVGPRRTRLVVTGTARRGVRKGFAGLSGQP